MQPNVERAASLVAPLVAEPGTLGAFLYGSSARPYSDPQSDLDVHVVVEDAQLASMPPDAHHRAIYEGGKQAADVWIVSPGVLEQMMASLADVHRRRLSVAKVLHDRDGVVSRILTQASEVPDALRETRMKVHYFEVTRLAKRVHTSERRGKADMVRVLSAELVVAAAKVLFFERRQWPAPIGWMFAELGLAGIPAPLVEALEAAVEAPTSKGFRVLRGRLDAYLLEAGVTFLRDPAALWHWLFETPEGREAMDAWGGESIRR